jgi:hypothetical protein
MIQSLGLSKGFKSPEFREVLVMKGLIIKVNVFYKVGMGFFGREF